jgi:hypothetical protein
MLSKIILLMLLLCLCCTIQQQNFSPWKVFHLRVFFLLLLLSNCWSGRVIFQLHFHQQRNTLHIEILMMLLRAFMLSAKDT